MSNVPLDTFNYNYDDSSTPRSLMRLFQNPFLSGDSLSRDSVSRRRQLEIFGALNKPEAAPERRHAWQDYVTTEEPKRPTIRPMLSFLITEFITSCAMLFGFFQVVNIDNVPILFTSIACGFAAIILIIMVACGRRVYPLNVLAYHIFLACLIVVVVHFLKQKDNDHDFIHPLGVSLVICLASAMGTLVLSLLPSPQVDNQLLYVVPPIVVTGMLSTLACFTSSWPLNSLTFQLIPLSFVFMLPSTILTTLCIRGYDLRCSLQ